MLTRWLKKPAERFLPASASVYYGRPTMVWDFTANGMPVCKERGPRCEIPLPPVAVGDEWYIEDERWEAVSVTCQALNAGQCRTLDSFITLPGDVIRSTDGNMMVFLRNGEAVEFK